MCTSGLKAIQQLLETPELKLKKAADTHWLSHDAACHTLVKVLPSVITSLEREAEEREVQVHFNTIYDV